jgi:capsular polysaccharide transport system permease protein
MMFTAGVVVVWSLLKTHTMRLPLIPFLITGYSSVLLWRNTIGRCGNAIEPNRSLLHHRYVRVLDLFVARLLLEVAGASISFLTLGTLLTLAGFMQPPADLLPMLFAWLLLAWFAMGMGLLIGSLSVLSESVDRVWHVIGYLFLPVSGAFFMVDWLPKRIQAIAEYVPTVNATELLRGGYFGRGIHAHYDLRYTIIVNLVLTLIALAAVKAVSSTVEGE